MKPRSNHFWQEIVLCTYTDSDWIESFRMSAKIFNDLCFLLRPALEPKPLLLKSRESLSVEKQVAVALYKLASCAEYRVVGNVFGIHKSTVKKCLFRVVNAVNHLMMEDYLQMPNIYKTSKIAINFEMISHIPQIFGCIDGTHIPILAPSEGYRDFVNRKGWPSYVLQAVVDNKCRFKNICVRHPGSTYDAAVLKDSSLYKNVKNIIPQVEMAFGRLKARWRILLKRIDVDHTFVPNIVSCCCILQNFLESRNEQFFQQWLNDVVEAEIIYPQPANIINQERDDISGSTIRKHLTDYLSNNFPLRTSVLR
ncbi:Putative nuclease HARBI1 [Cyphomyrmex costatus]|uniref:Putative nuclease HARBI1 n=1 Tax=Cyphomyrmex costatus TaxID=456900 RepID=A0A151ICS1_9HYME|nr:Putative nuclease HARBI1 [Cyphomyrmex costatus]